MRLATPSSEYSTRNSLGVSIGRVASGKRIIGAHAQFAVGHQRRQLWRSSPWFGPRRPVCHRPPWSPPPTAATTASVFSAATAEFGLAVQGEFHAQLLAECLARDHPRRNRCSAGISSVPWATKRFDLPGDVAEGLASRREVAVSRLGDAQFRALRLFRPRPVRLMLRRRQNDRRAAGSRNTTKMEPAGSNEIGTKVRPFSSRQTGAGWMPPVSAFHNSGVRPVTRKLHSTESNRWRWLDTK